MDSTAPTWETIRVLGSGRATTVWEGRDRRLDRPVAIKELHESLAARGGFADRYLAEARRMATVSDARVLTVHAVDDTADPPRLIVERADGTARDLVDRGPLQPEQAERLLTHALQGLAAVHRQGIVHRGVKPENLFVCGDGYKIGDFGIGHSADTPTLFLSSPRYTAPEQLATESSALPDPRTDLYSLGLVLYELLLGRQGFEEAVAETVDPAAEGGPGELDRWLRFHRDAPDLPAPAALNPSVLETLSRVVARLAAKDPETRYQGAEDALRELRARRGTDDRPAEPGATPAAGSAEDPTMTLGALEARAAGRRRKRTLWIAVSTIVVLLGAAVAFVAVRARQFALVDVTSDPPGAAVLFDDELVGTTPEERLKVRIGTELTLRKEGYEPATVTLEENAQETLHADLEPLEPDADAEPDRGTELATDTPERMVDGLLALRDPGTGPRISPVRSGRTTIPFGDPLAFTVEPDRDGFLVLFTVSSDGTVHRLYPGPGGDSFPVTARARLTLPLPEDRQAGFELIAAAPAGPETVFALIVGEGVAAPRPPDPPAGVDGSRWLVTYPFDGPGSPAAELVRWVATLRRGHPEAIGLAALELRIVPDPDMEDAP